MVFPAVSSNVRGGVKSHQTNPLVSREKVKEKGYFAYAAKNPKGSPGRTEIEGEIDGETVVSTTLVSKPESKAIIKDCDAGTTTYANYLECINVPNPDTNSTTPFLEVAYFSVFQIGANSTDPTQTIACFSKGLAKAISTCGTPTNYDYDKSYTDLESNNRFYTDVHFPPTDPCTFDYGNKTFDALVYDGCYTPAPTDAPGPAPLVNGDFPWKPVLIVGTIFVVAAFAGIGYIKNRKGKEQNAKYNREPLLERNALPGDDGSASAVPKGASTKRTWTSWVSSFGATRSSGRGLEEVDSSEDDGDGHDVSAVDIDIPAATSGDGDRSVEQQTDTGRTGGHHPTVAASVGIRTPQPGGGSVPVLGAGASSPK